MERMDLAVQFDIREPWYYQSGNIFLGSAGALRFKIQPEGETLQVYTWFNGLCFDKGDVGEPVAFPLSDEGLEQVRADLQEQAAAHHSF